jgi:Response regulators consisting of a CheY-like receiver domain and a winged-helix DNA-binding domain
MAHIGLLEDNTRIAKLCATMLRYSGHRVTIYSHPRACLTELLPCLDERSLLLAPAAPGASHVSSATCVVTVPIDVLIMDLHLPDIPGLEVVRMLRSQPQTLSLPLIFCTAATGTEIAAALRIAPHALCVEKPFTIQELNQAILKVVRH